MGTDNRRVAAYLPKEIYDRLKVFIEERGLKGDSPALIAILSDYFGVNQQVAQSVDYSSFVIKEEFSELAKKVAALAVAIESREPPADILGKLSEKLRKIESRIDCLEATTEELEISPSSVAGNDLHSGQMSLLDSSVKLANHPKGEAWKDDGKLYRQANRE